MLTMKPATEPKAIELFINDFGDGVYVVMPIVTMTDGSVMLSSLFALAYGLVLFAKQHPKLEVVDFTPDQTNNQFLVRTRPRLAN